MRDLVKRVVHFWRQRLGLRILPLLSTVRVVGLVLAALALWGFAQIADEVLERETQSFDTAVLLALRSLHTPVLDRIMVGFTILGQPSVLLVVCLLISGLLLYRGQRSSATTLAIAALGAGGLNVLLKDVFARNRPELWQRAIDVRFYSFPSGHAMISLVVYGMLGYLLAVHLQRWQKLITVLTILLVGTIGFSRLYLGVHWPTDVIAGYAAGLVWLLACIFSLEIWHRRGLLSRSSTSDLPIREEELERK